MNIKTRGYTALTITSVVWGTTWVVSKIASRSIHPLQVAWLRQLIAGALLIAFFLLIKKVPLPTKKQFGWLFVMSILMFVFANGFSTWGIRYIPAGFASLIGALYPLSVVLLEMIFYKRRFVQRLTWIGMLLGLFGIGMVFYDNSFHSPEPNFLFGILLSLFAMLSWSLGSIFLSRNKENINPYYGLGWQMLMGAVILYISTSLAGYNTPLPDFSLPLWGMMLYLVILGSIIAFVSFIYSVKVLPIAIASLYAYINPLVAIVLGSFLLDEKITPMIVFGSMITLLGVFAVNYSVKKQHLKGAKL